MNEDQMVWASRHDWYLGYKQSLDDTFSVIVRAGEQSRKTVSTFQELLIWAGYR